MAGQSWLCMRPETQIVPPVLWLNTQCVHIQHLFVWARYFQCACIVRLECIGGCKKKPQFHSTCSAMENIGHTVITLHAHWAFKTLVFHYLFFSLLFVISLNINVCRAERQCIVCFSTEMENVGLRTGAIKKKKLCQLRCDLSREIAISTFLK